MATPLIGEQLRAAREARGLSFEALRATTKVRPEFLRALEEERFGDLPPRAFARGYLRTYAIALGLDPAPLLSAFDEALPLASVPSRLAGRAEVPIVPARRRSPLRRAVAIAIAVAAMAAVAVAIIAALQIRAFVRSGARPPQQPAVSAPAPAPPPLERGPAPQPAPAPKPQGVTVSVLATARCWIRATVDGRRVFEGTLRAGDQRTWNATRDVLLRIGNAGGLRVSLNGHDLGLLGRAGEVVDRTFAAEAPPP